MGANDINAIASRVLDNLQKSDLDPSGNCFLAARAIQILANGGELAEGRLNEERHVWYFAEIDGEVLHWDVTADGCGGERLMFGVPELPPAYAEVAGWEWPEGYSAEFANDLVSLVRPNGGAL